MGIFTSAGTVLSIGGSTPPATFDAAGYSALTWVVCGKLENGGALGDESAEVTFDDLAERRTLKLKGQDNAGNMELVLGLDDADAGQDDLLDAQADKSTADYYFRVQFANKRNATGTGAIRYFGAKVFSVRETIDTANNVTKLNVMLGINTAIVRVKSTAGA